MVTRKLQGFEIGYKGLQGNVLGYKGLQGVTRSCLWLQEVTRGYKGLQEVTRGYKWLQEVTRIVNITPCATYQQKLYLCPRAIHTGNKVVNMVTQIGYNSNNQKLQW